MVVATCFLVAKMCFFSFGACSQQPSSLLYRLATILLRNKTPAPKPSSKMSAMAKPLCGAPPLLYVRPPPSAVQLMREVFHMWLLGLTASLISQFFSREFCGKKTCFSRKYQCESRESHESREKGKMQYIVKLQVSQFASLAIYDSQTSKIIIHSEKLVLDPKFSQGSRIKTSNDSRESRYEISV
jgi:hypothetical protein